VFLAFAGSRGRARIDRALYLPKGWAADADRRDAAGVAEGVGLATKPRLAGAMVGRARRPGVRAAWVTGDAVCGRDGAFRRVLERARQPHVLAVPAGRRLRVGLEQRRVDARAAAFASGAWHRAGAGGGSKGPRVYDRAVAAHGPVDERGWRRWLLVRRHRAGADERAYYLCRGPADTPWEELARAAGARRAVEECFGTAKGTCGLDQYEVRAWAGWHRHVALSLWALAIPAAVRVAAGAGRTKGARSGSRWACPRCGCRCSGSCGREARRPRTCWRGRSGGGHTNIAPAGATTGRAGPIRPSNQLQL
jgi:SRSO17 transposase